MQEYMKVFEKISGTATVTHRCARKSNGFALLNKGASDVTFTINGITITVPFSTSFEDSFEDFTTVIITATTAFEAVIKGF